MNWPLIVLVAFATVVGLVGAFTVYGFGGIFSSVLGLREDPERELAQLTDEEEAMIRATMQGTRSATTPWGTRPLQIAAWNSFVVLILVATAFFIAIAVKQWGLGLFHERLVWTLLTATSVVAVIRTIRGRNR